MRPAAAHARTTSGSCRAQKSPGCRSPAVFAPRRHEGPRNSRACSSGTRCRRCGRHRESRPRQDRAEPKRDLRCLPSRACAPPARYSAHPTTPPSHAPKAAVRRPTHTSRDSAPTRQPRRPSGRAPPSARCTSGSAHPHAGRSLPPAQGLSADRGSTTKTKTAQDPQRHTVRAPKAAARSTDSRPV